MPLAFQLLPLCAGAFQLLLVVTIEHEDDPLIGFDRWRFSAIDDKSHRRGTGISFANREENWLICREDPFVSAMRQEAIFPKCPQMLIEQIPPRHVFKLHSDPPAALDAFFEQRWEGILQLGFRQMIEKDFRHAS